MASIFEGYFETMDRASAELMLQLQLTDCEELFSSSKGKGREGELSDADIAFQLYKADLDMGTLVISDRRMAQSIACAVQLDGRILRETFYEEERAEKDHEMARNLATGVQSNSLSITDRMSVNDEIDDELLAKMQALYVADLDDNQPFLDDIDNDGQNSVVGEEAEPSLWAEARPRARPSMDRRCEACHENKKFFDVARAPCRHEYCRDCLQELFEMSLTDESLFPPRCCRQPIPITSVRLFLKSKLIHEYADKAIEFGTPNRTYCSSKSCSAFIAAENVANDIATCAACGTTTCAVCKEASHHGDCPNDVALQQVIQTANEAGWQRCYSCWRIVELEIGCNHMTCRCGAQFCYVCGLQWKSCTCEQWDEHRLLARANQIVDRDLGPNQIVDLELDRNPILDRDLEPPEPAIEPLDDNPVDGAAPLNLPILPLDPAPTPRTALVAQVIENLRQNHECQHDRWRWVQGRHQCEECYHHLPQYIFECRQCRLLACGRCRRNRL